jgi:hypothetical protein
MRPVRRTSPVTAVPAFLPPCYRTGVVVANGRLTTNQADVMVVVGNGRWSRTAYHGVRRTSLATAVPAFLPPCYITGVVVANGRLTTDQADVMMVVGNGRWADTVYHDVGQA